MNHLLTRQRRHLALILSLLAWLGLIAVPAVNAQGGEHGVWIRLCLGTGTSWVKLSLDDDPHQTQNNHCPCTQNALDTAWQPEFAFRPLLPQAPAALPLTPEPKPITLPRYLTRAPPAVA